MRKNKENSFVTSLNCHVIILVLPKLAFLSQIKKKITKISKDTILGKFKALCYRNISLFCKKDKKKIPKVRFFKENYGSGSALKYLLSSNSRLTKNTLDTCHN